MGFFSREPPLPLPDREDLSVALDGLHRADAENIRSKRHLAVPCSQLPADRPIVAVLSAVIDSPGDRGLLCATDNDLTFYGEHTAPATIPMRAIYQVGLIYRGNTLSVTFGSKEAHFGVSFNKPESLEFFVSRVQAAAERAQSSQAVATASPADELAKFASLHQSGVLTDEEFAAKKAELLG